MQVLSDKLKTANQEHNCDLCGAKIKAKEKYWYQVLKDYGEFHTFKRHEKCENIARKLSMYDCDDGLNDYGFELAIQEEYDRLYNPNHYEYFADKEFQEKLKSIITHHLG